MGLFPTAKRFRKAPLTKTKKKKSKKRKMKKEYTLKQVIELMNKIKQNDIHDEYEIFFHNIKGKTTPIIQSKKIWILN